MRTDHYLNPNVSLNYWTNYHYSTGIRRRRVYPVANKNSSGDEIANVNFLRRYGTYVLQNTKKEKLLRLTN